MPDTTIRPPPPGKPGEGVKLESGGLELIEIEQCKEPRPFDFGDSNIKKPSPQVMKAPKVMTQDEGVGAYLLRYILIPLLISTTIASIVTYVVMRMRSHSTQTATEQKGNGQ